MAVTNFLIKSSALTINSSVCGDACFCQILSFHAKMYRISQILLIFELQRAKLYNYRILFYFIILIQKA